MGTASPRRLGKNTKTFAIMGSLDFLGLWVMGKDNGGYAECGIVCTVS